MMRLHRETIGERYPRTLIRFNLHCDECGIKWEPTWRDRVVWHPNTEDPKALARIEADDKVERLRQSGWLRADGKTLCRSCAAGGEPPL